MPGGMRLPSESFNARRQPIPSDLTASGETLFPALPSAARMQDPVAPTLDVTRFCEAFTQPVNFAAGGNLVPLPRTNAKRYGLLIVNVNIAGGVFYCFDTVATATGAVPITNGGNRLFDVAVPQGDLNIFASGAGLVIIEYLLASPY